MATAIHRVPMTGGSLPSYIAGLPVRRREVRKNDSSGNYYDFYWDYRVTDSLWQLRYYVSCVSREEKQEEIKIAYPVGQRDRRVSVRTLA